MFGVSPTQAHVFLEDIGDFVVDFAHFYFRIKKNNKNILCIVSRERGTIVQHLYLPDFEYVEFDYGQRTIEM